MLSSEEIRERFDSPDEYGDYLRFGGADGWSPIPGEFIKDYERIWFVSGGSQCVGSAFCKWHNGMDPIYSVGSCTIANIGVTPEKLEEAVMILEAMDGFNLIDKYDHEERKWLIELSRAALSASPSDDVQFVYE